MIDLAEARAALDAARISGASVVLLSPEWLEQALAEIEAGRASEARLGRTFGLKGQKL
jgi:hypothetical protein